MILNSRTQYGILVIKELKNAEVSQTIKLQDISDKYNISIHFLEQVARDLRLAGLILSRKGPGGGYFLNQDETPISVGDVYLAVSKTKLKHACSIHDGMDKVERVYQSIVDMMKQIYI